jgi:hypothetical protein
VGDNTDEAGDFSAFSACNQTPFNSHHVIQADAKCCGPKKVLEDIDSHYLRGNRNKTI